MILRQFLCLWAALVVGACGVIWLNQNTHATAKPSAGWGPLHVVAQDVTPPVRESKGGAETMTFAKHLALNPEMFDGDENNADVGAIPDLKGGVLGDPKTVRALLFLKGRYQQERSGRPAD